MGNLQNTVSGLAAFGTFDASANAFKAQRGFGTVTDNGVGDWTILLSTPLTDASCLINATLTEGVGNVQCVPVLSGSEVVSIRCKVFSLSQATPPVSAAADLDFSIQVMEITPS